MVSGGCLRDSVYCLVCSNVETVKKKLTSTPGGQVCLLKDNEFWGVLGVSGGCLGVSGGCL